MKQKIITGLVLLAMTALAIPASAQELKVRTNATSSPVKVRAEMKAKIQDRMASSSEKRAEMKAEFEARKASTTAKRIEIQQSLAKRKAEHTAKVLMATIERLEKIVARVESRIAKVKAEGAAVAESEGFIAEAKTHLSEAKASLSAFASVDLSAEKANENFERVKNLAAETKTHIRAAHQSLMNAIRSLKGYRAGDKNATSTNATSTSQ